jgi:hypothetical protein
MISALALFVAARSQAIVIEGFRPASEGMVSARAMRYLPFDVPAGVTRITVHKELDHGPDAGAGRIVDHGLFDPRGLDGRGFRGWMGGSSADIVVTGDAATTSSWFMPGPLPAGRWHLAQYYLQATPSGVKYRYTVTFDFDGPRPPATMPPIPAYRPGTLKREAGWYAGNLHAHTRHSDGGDTLEALARKNRAEGYDFLVSTEHNTPRAHWEFAGVGRAVPDLLLIAGDEFTSPAGHANILGSRPGHWFDFRFDAGEGRFPSVVREAHRQGAVVTMNHPFALCTTCPWRYPESEWRGTDGIEVWNGKWDLTDEQAVTWWDELLRRGLRIHAYGGSDYHRGNDPLTPATRVWASRLETKAIMDGLRRGRTVLATNPRAPSLALAVGRAMPGDTVDAKDATPVEVDVQGGEGLRLVVLSDAGVVEEAADLGAGTVHRTLRLDLRGRRFLRAELRRGGRKGEMVALTNALFIR